MLSETQIKKICTTEKEVVKVSTTDFTKMDTYLEEYAKLVQLNDKAGVDYYIANFEKFLKGVELDQDTRDRLLVGADYITQYFGLKALESLSIDMDLSGDKGNVHKITFSFDSFFNKDNTLYPLLEKSIPDLIKNKLFPSEDTATTLP